MLSFVAEFPVNADKTAEDFLVAAKAWILGSPHTNFRADDLNSLTLEQEFKANQNGQSLYCLPHLGETETVALRLSTLEHDLGWSSEVVFSRDRSDSWIGVRTSREALQPSLTLPSAKKPVVIRTVLQMMGGGYDGELRVLDSPHILLEHQIDHATRLIFGDAGCWLPVIYASIPFNDHKKIDLRDLARGLSGLAHVVIEPSRDFSVRLQANTSSENVYGGVVGIYWPDSAGRRSYFFPRDFNNYRDMKRAIIDEIRTALLNRRPLQRCTFSAAQEARSRATIEGLKANGSLEVEEYAAAFDEEIKAKNQQLYYAESEIYRLKSELRSYEKLNPSGSGIVLNIGSEQNFFPNEILNILLNVIERATDNEQNGSRRQHILIAISEANSNSKTSISSTNREVLKELLRNYTIMTKPIKTGLESLGFTISEDGKHYKLTYRGDDRYVFALQKTGSDYRGGLNAASDIAKRVY